MTIPQELVADRYRLVRTLGSGGMGRVWLARDKVLHRDVAVKEVIPPEGLTPGEREELRRRTLREARAAARLSHPNVVRIYDVIRTEKQPWIVMEYVPSRSLHQVVNEDGPLPPERVARIGLDVLAALQAAHRAGVLHRDVKPANVLLAEDGRVVLGDFGLATFEGGEGTVTRPGLILGSPQYIAPERAREGVSLPESDLWSLGATLYAAVEGRSPYARTTAIATLTALATEDPDPMVRAGALKPALNGLLRKDPRNRASASDAERLLFRAAGIMQRRSRTRLLPMQRRPREEPVAQRSAAPAPTPPAVAPPAPPRDKPAPAGPGGSVRELPGGPQVGPAAGSPANGSVVVPAFLPAQRPTQPSAQPAGEDAAPGGDGRDAAPSAETTGQGARPSSVQVRDEAVPHEPTADELMTDELTTDELTTDEPMADESPTQVLARPSDSRDGRSRPRADRRARTSESASRSSGTPGAASSTEVPASGPDASAGGTDAPVDVAATAGAAATLPESGPEQPPAPAASGPAAPGPAAPGRAAPGRAAAGRGAPSAGSRTAGAQQPHARPADDHQTPTLRLLVGTRGVRPWRLAAAIVALVVLAVLVAVIITARKPEGGPGAARPEASASSPTSAGAVNAAQQPSTLSTKASQAGQPPAGSLRGSPVAGAGDLALLAGWVWYTDPTGFRVAVPGNWDVSRSGSVVNFRDPASGRMLAVDQYAAPKLDPVANWTAQEATRVRNGDLPGYTRLGIVAFPFWKACADWEYTYNDPSTGGRLHAVDRGFLTTATQGYALLWITRDVDWGPNRPYFDLVAASFRPAAT